MIQKLGCGEGGFVVNTYYFGNFAYCIDNLLAFIEICHPLLAVVAPAHCGPHIEAPRIGLHLTEQQAYECGFPGTVVAHDSNLFMACEDIVEIVEDYLISECLAYMVRLENLIAYVACLYIELHVLLAQIHMAA